MASGDADELQWLDAGGGYALALDDGRLVSRNAKGKKLNSVPAAIRDSEVAVQLRALRDWLVSHDASCAATVESWMLRSLPVPLSALAPLWPDPSWRRALLDTVVAPVSAGDEALDWEGAGLLRDVDGRGAGVVTLDGETKRLDVAQLAVPHPVLFDDLSEWRDFATDLGVSQGVPQLYRETFAKPDDIDRNAGQVGDFAHGQFEQLRHALGRCRTIGVTVSGGYAVCKVWESGELTEARYWIGADDPDSPAWTGDIVWIASDSRPIQLVDVGPVAWSEGIRMASLVYAGRKVEEEDDAA